MVNMRMHAIIIFFGRRFNVGSINDMSNLFDKFKVTPMSTASYVLSPSTYYFQAIIISIISETIDQWDMRNI